MKKDTFLAIIQGEARRPGEAQKVWENSINISENDPRWDYIQDESESPMEIIRQYCKFFSFDLPQRVAPKQKRMTQVERWANLIEKNMKMKDSITPQNMAAFERNIEEIEAKLAHAIKNNL